MYSDMGIERQFPDFRKELKALTGDDRDETDAADFAREYYSDPHLENLDVSKLADEDLALLEKFRNNELTEEAVNDRLEHLPDGSPSSNFVAALKNKLVMQKAWERRMSREV